MSDVRKFDRDLADAGMGVTFVDPRDLEAVEAAILFQNPRTGDQEIYLTDNLGSPAVNLSNSPSTTDASGSWCPDGTRIVFMCWERLQGGSQDLCFVNPDGTGFARLGGEGAQGPVGSPDGTRIAYLCRDDGDPEICVMNADESGRLNLTNTPGSDLEPGWSADGASIVFISNRDGNHEVYVMDASGGGQTNATNDPGLDQRPRIRP